MAAESSSPQDAEYASGLSNRQAKFTQLVNERSRRRGIHTDSVRLLYANECVYQWCRVPPRRSLYIGVGHGFDALLALKTGLTEHIIGVDPYIDSDGNDNEDYGHLMTMLEEFEMQDRFSIERRTIQDYLQDHSGGFDLIVCNDVLHHIFWTDALLSESEFFPEAVSLFRELREVTIPGGNLIVADVERHGLRQILSALGVLKTSVDYGAKQPRREWCHAAAEAGWVLENQANYVPWGLRGQAKIWSGSLGRFSVCDKYILHFSSPDK